jgi:methionine biosynthesis protein MetW
LESNGEAAYFASEKHRLVPRAGIILTNLLLSGKIAVLTMSFSLRLDQQRIADLISPGSRVLDVGCGNGELLQSLVTQRKVIGRGMEISQAGVNECVAKGLAVVQGDADTDLADYPDNAFHYAVLSQTLQATYQPREVLQQLARISAQVIISFPNFGYWKIRLQLLYGGKMPVSRMIPYAWYDTPNIHLCTWHDIEALCTQLGLTVRHRLAFAEHEHKNIRWWPNGRAAQGVLLVGR